MRPIPFAWNIPPSLAALVGDTAGQQRMLEHGGHVLLVLHRCPTLGQRGREAAIFWRSPQKDWRASPGRDHVDSLTEHLESFHKELVGMDERLEEAETAADFFELIRWARPVHRTMRHALNVLTQLRDRFPEELLYTQIRERAYELERHADFAVGEAEAGLQFRIAQRAEDQAKQSERIAFETHRLNMLSAFFLPITAIAGLFGMNLASGIENSTVAFGVVAVACLATGLIVRSMVRPPQ